MKISPLFLSLLLLTVCKSQAQYLVTTVAGGGGLLTAASNGTKANDVLLGGSLPAIAVDSNGDVYLPNEGADVLLKISSGGILTFAAGAFNTPGSSGDGGPATGALLFAPTGVAADGQGNIYILEANGQRLRKIDRTGTISTLAQFPSGGSQQIAVDANGNVYAGQPAPCYVTKVDPSGNVSVFAGNGTCGTSGDGGPANSASIFPGSGMTVDSAGNLYLADSFSHQIRKIDTKGIITTVPGGTQPANATPSCSAADSGFVPSGIAVDSAGNLYGAIVAGCIRKLSPAGVVTPIAGNGTRGFSGDGGPAIQAELDSPAAITMDQAGNLYFVDNGRVRKVNPAGAISTVGGPASTYYDEKRPATSVYLGVTNGIAIAADGTSYVSDYAQVFRISPAGIISTVAGNGAVGYGGDGGPANAALLNYAAGVALDAPGAVYIADELNSRVRKVSPDGTITTVAGNGTAGFSGDGGQATDAELMNPEGLAIDSEGNLYIADSGNARVRKVTPQGIITTIAENRQPGNLADGGPAISVQLTSPNSVALDTAGNLYIADGGAHGIRKLDASGVITKIASTGQPGFTGDGGPASAASLSYPHGVAVDSHGNIFILDAGNNVVRKIDTTGTISTVGLTRANAPANLNLNLIDDDGSTKMPGGAIALDSNGNLYIADWADSVLLKGVPTSSMLLSSAANAATFPPTGVQAAPGSILTLYGLNLSNTRASAPAPLPTQIGDTSVTVNNLAAPLFYVSNNQINLQVPFETTPGTASIVVSRTGGGSATIPVLIGSEAPGIFTVTVEGDRSKGGEYISIYATGLGDVTNRPADGAATPGPPYSNTVATPTVTIGGVPATITYSGLAPTLVGVYQINALVPNAFGYLNLSIAGASVTPSTIFVD